MKTIVGLFDTFADAKGAVRDLESSRFDRKCVSIIANKDKFTGGEISATTTPTASTEQLSEVSTGEGATLGAMTGAGIGAAGGLLAGALGLFVPGIGQIVAAGW